MIIVFNYNVNGMVYDYIGCVYPYGINNGKNDVFNHSQIDKVYHVGFINLQEKKFKEDLLSVGLKK